jgi:hypothetical protein
MMLIITKLKRLNLNSRLRLLKTFTDNKKYTSINTKLLIYKSLIKPIWTYGIQLWGNAKKSNLNKIQASQNIALRKLLNAPPPLRLKPHYPYRLKNQISARRSYSPLSTLPQTTCLQQQLVNTEPRSPFYS